MEKKKILVIEDDTSIAHVLNLKLTHSGFEVFNVLTGEEALEVLKSKPDEFDLILLDLILPGISGFEVLNKINEIKIKTPVIVLSNLGQKEDIEKATNLGVAGYVVKSKLPLADIVKKIQKALDSN